MPSVVHRSIQKARFNGSLNLFQHATLFEAETLAIAKLGIYIFSGIQTGTKGSFLVSSLIRSWFGSV